METIEVHSGYDFPYLSIPSTSFRDMSVRSRNCLHDTHGTRQCSSNACCISPKLGARYHDFHHSNFTGNFAPTFRWWDWLFGTDKQYRDFLSQSEDEKKLKKEN